jgi:flagellar biogenesis protein FliO
MKPKHRIIENPEPFNHQTSKLFVVVSVILALGLIALAVWIFVSSQ